MTGIVPPEIAAGVNFNATASRPEFSGDEWSLLLILRGAVSVDLAAERVGTCHAWDVGAAATATWPPGVYAYAVRATNGTDVREVERGQTTVTPDLAAMPEGHDPRTPNQKALDAIEAVIAKRATLDQERYRINNRELYRTPIGDLLRLRKHYRQLVREESGRARTGFRDIPVTMRPIGR